MSNVASYLVACVHVPSGSVIRRKPVPSQERVLRVVNRALEKAHAAGEMISLSSIRVFVIERDANGEEIASYDFPADWADELANSVN